RLVQRTQPLVLQARHDHQVLVQDRAAANARIGLFEPGQFLAPDDLAVEIETGQNAGAEEGEDLLAVRHGRRHRVTVIDVLDQGDELAGRDNRVPQFAAVPGVEAEDVMDGNGLAPFLLAKAGWKDRGSEEDAVLPDDGAGPAR